MSTTNHRTALVTGASSGLGKEAAAQFAGEGYGHVIITARTSAKAEQARTDLEASTNTSVFETLELDLDDHASVEAAARTLTERGTTIDVLILNAGLVPGNDVAHTSNGIEATAAATLIGHHLLTMRLLEAGLLADEARIVIAGSEAARGDVPMFKPIDVHALAAESFGGDLESAVEGVMRMSPPIKFDPGNQYATVKLFAAWWAAELSDRLPQGHDRQRGVSRKHPRHQRRSKCAVPDEAGPRSILQAGSRDVSHGERWSPTLRRCGRIRTGTHRKVLRLAAEEDDRTTPPD